MTRLRLALLAGVSLCTATACVDPVSGHTTLQPSFSGVDEAEEPLLQLATPCRFDGGVMTVSLSAGEYSLISQSPSGELHVNRRACGTATVSNTNSIGITGSPDGGNETVIIDYLSGSFALGNSTRPGIVIDLKGGSGDTLKVRTSTGIDTLVLGTVDAGVGSAGMTGISVSINSSSPPDAYRDIALSNTERVVISTGPGNDVVNAGGGSGFGVGSASFGAVASGSSPALTVYGGDGDDTITGGVGADVLFGENGDDTFGSSLGNDTENGGAGDDLFREGSSANGADIIVGGDELDGGVGADSVMYDLRSTPITVAVGGGAVSGAFLTDGGFESDSLGDSIEVVYGGSGNDLMSCAGALGCALHGNGGNDVLTGSSAIDDLFGEGGDDTILSGVGTDTIDCGPGTGDAISYADRAASSALAVTLGAGGIARAGNGQVDVDGGVLEDDSIAGCENIIGGAGDDALTGNELDNRLTGGLGDDTLSGLDGNDTFDEGSVSSGADVFFGGLGEDLVDYRARTHALTCDLSDDVGTDGEANEHDNIRSDVEDINGGTAGSTIVGNPLDNKIDPGSGTNTVTCGAGFDILIPNGSTTNAANDCEASAAPLVSIAVTPANPTSIKSTSRQFTAIGRYSDSTTVNLTTSSSLTWASSSPSTAIISNAAGSRGRASTINPGTTVISATVGSITGSTTLTVLAASLVSISVTPHDPSVALGFTRTFLAQGTYSDGSTADLSAQVTWSSDDDNVAIVSNMVGSQGLTTTLAQGSTVIRATLGSVSGSTALTVGAPVLIGPIDLTPADSSVAAAGTLQFTANGSYSDGSTQDITSSVTWASSTPATATIASGGLATGVASGATTITATLDGLSGSTSLTVP